ncbi:hypothetical protein FHT44_005021 [Mycolicibacterium sp. BK634]|nr:hypothetical protein [Mycolicibacterium sp. BK634]
MARMMGANFKRVGRCHPWCGNREYLVGRASENAEWLREDWDLNWTDAEWNYLRDRADANYTAYEWWESLCANGSPPASER